MSSIRLLNTGEWSKPPVLTAARRIFIKGLGEHLPKATLGSMASFVNGTSYDTGKLSGDGTPIIRISNITNPESDFLKTTQEFDSRFLANRGDLLVSWSASFKSIIWPKERGIVNQHIFKVTEEPGYHRGFVRHTIEAVFDDLQENVVGIGMKHLRRRDFLEYAVPNPDLQTQELVSNYLDWLENRNGETEPSLPPKLSEQRRIVGRLEHLASKIEEARGLRDEAATECKVITKSAARQVLKSVDTDITQLREWLDKNRDGVQTGPFGAQMGKSDFKDSGHPVLTIGNVQYGGLRLEGLKYVTEEKAKALSRFAVREGDILFARMGTVGRCCVVPPDAEGWLINYHIIRVALDQSRVHSSYVHWLIQASPDIEEYLEKQVRGATRQGVNSSIVASLPCRVPPMAEQLRIVEHLDHLQVEVDSLKQLQAQTRGELDALLPSILDKAFRGEL